MIAGLFECRGREVGILDLGFLEAENVRPVDLEPVQYYAKA